MCERYVPVHTPFISTFSVTGSRRRNVEGLQSDSQVLMIDVIFYIGGDNMKTELEHIQYLLRYLVHRTTDILLSDWNIFSEH